MSNVNIAGIATGAFFGLLAIIGVVSCVPPITRFLGDLFCCPWRIPFTKKRRRNGDEEMDKEDLPYVAGSQNPKPGTAVDNEDHNRMSAAWMSAVHVVDPETAKQEYRRSAEYHHREHSPYGSGSHSQQHEAYGYHHHQDHHHYHHHAHSGSHLQVPGPGSPPEVLPSPPQQQEGYWPSPGERTNTYPPSPPQPYGHADGYSPDEYYGSGSGSGSGSDAYAPQGYVDVQCPPPSHVYSPPAESDMTGVHGGGGGGGGGAHEYFPPQREYDEHDYGGRHYQSSEQLFGSRQQGQHYPNI